MCERKDARRQTPDARNLILIGVLGILMVSACDIEAAPTPSTAPGTTNTTGVPSTTLQEPWMWGVDEVVLRRGYRLGPCDGDADQIACIAQDGTVVGFAEYLALPVDTFESLDGVDDPVETIEIIADEYLFTFRADRESACPDLEFRELTPSPVTVGGQRGLRYGFDQLDGGRVVERNLVYGVRGDDTVGLFNFSATAEGACVSNEGELSDPAILDSLLHTLDQVMAAVESG